MEILTVSLTDDRYPPLLRQIAQPPHFLYVRGNLEVLKHPLPLAAVGTRKMTLYGATVAKKIIEPAAAAGMAIISGLALGIDAACHEAALRAKGVTIAVLAGGVDPASIGPKTNAGLAERIVRSGGALISELPPGSPSYKGGFILRNRIIAGMSRGTLVIEAAAKSGALATAYMALDANRDVFAIPGPITAIASVGTNALLRRGAGVITCADDLLGFYGLSTADAAAARIAATPKTDHERMVFMALDRGPADTDALIERTGLDAREVTVALTALIIADAIAEHGGLYVKH